MVIGYPIFPTLAVGELNWRLDFADWDYVAVISETIDFVVVMKEDHEWFFFGKRPVVIVDALNFSYGVALVFEQGEKFVELLWFKRVVCCPWGLRFDIGLADQGDVRFLEFLGERGRFGQPHADEGGEKRNDKKKGCAAPHRFRITRLSFLRRISANAPSPRVKMLAGSGTAVALMRTAAEPSNWTHVAPSSCDINIG